MNRLTQTRYPLGLLGMIGFLIAGESLVAKSKSSIDMSTRMSLAWQRSGEAARFQVIDAEILCFGDSLMKLGVQPLVLKAELGRSTYNFAVPGGQAPSTYYLLRRALNSGAKPEVILVNYHENLLAIAPRFSKHAYPHLLDVKDWFDLTCHARDPDLAASTGLALMFPSIRYRKGIQARIVARLKSQPREMMEELRALDRNWTVNAGAQVASSIETPQSTTPADQSMTAPRQRSTWSPHSVNLAYVTRFLELTRQQGIPVYWVLTPTRAVWNERRKQIGATEQFNAFLGQISESYDHLTFLDARDSNFGDEVFLDETHLDGRGAEVLSQGIANALKTTLQAQMQSTNRIDLPTFHTLTKKFALEDVNLSRQATRK